MYLLVFADDLLICAADKSKINEVKSKLMENFVLKDLGEVETYIGIEIEYKKDLNEMKLSQTKYIESLSEKYDLT